MGSIDARTGRAVSACRVCVRAAVLHAILACCGRHLIVHHGTLLMVMYNGGKIIQNVPVASVVMPSPVSGVNAATLRTGKGMVGHWGRAAATE